MPSRPASRAASRRTSYATRSRPTCSREAPTCARCRPCLVTPTSPPRKSTRTCREGACARSCANITRAGDESGTGTVSGGHCRRRLVHNHGLDAQRIRVAITYLIALILSIAVHEFGHAFVADRLGDRLPRTQGRVTLNPLAHIDLVGTIVMPLVIAFTNAPL